MEPTEQLDWVPSSCTLPTAERPLRVAEFDDVFRASTSVERPSPEHMQLLIADASRLEEVQDLARREASCCSFFVFDVAAVDESVSLDVRVPVEHVDVLDALARRARGTGHDDA